MSLDLARFCWVRQRKNQVTRNLIKMFTRTSGIDFFSTNSTSFSPRCAQTSGKTLVIPKTGSNARRTLSTGNRFQSIFTGKNSSFSEAWLNALVHHTLIIFQIDKKMDEISRQTEKDVIRASTAMFASRRIKTTAAPLQCHSDGFILGLDLAGNQAWVRHYYLREYRRAKQTTKHTWFSLQDGSIPLPPQYHECFLCSYSFR